MTTEYHTSKVRYIKYGKKRNKKNKSLNCPLCASTELITNAYRGDYHTDYIPSSKLFHCRNCGLGFAVKKWNKIHKQIKYRDYDQQSVTEFNKTIPEIERTNKMRRK